jgi:hypothetical protein
MTLFNMTRSSTKEGRDDDMLKKKKILISKEEFKKLHQDRIDCSQALVVMEDELTRTKKRLTLRNQELKKLRIERAEHLRRIEQLEKQNEDILKREKSQMLSSSGHGSGRSDSSRWSNAVNDNNNEVDYGYGNTTDSAPTNDNGSQDIVMSSPSSSAPSSPNVDYGYGDTEDFDRPATTAKIKRQMSRRASTSRRASICVVRQDNSNHNPDGTSTTTTTIATTTSRSRNSSRDKSRHKTKSSLKRPSISYNNLVRQNSMDENSMDADEEPEDGNMFPPSRPPFEIHERRPSKCRNNGTRRQARRTSTCF